MQKTKTKTGSVGVVIALIIVLAFIGVIAYLGISFGSLAAIGDAIKGSSYEPDAEMSKIIERDKFTKAGDRILRATFPELESADEFNQHCYSGAERESSVLGCYSGDRIYVYDIDNAELDGIKETVLAHELLHAVWNRMSAKERRALYDDLDSTYTIHSRELSEHMTQYSEDEYYDELHSVIGTQLASANLTEALRTHYAKYFTSQSLIANFYDSYNAKFEALERKAESLKSQIDNNKAKIESLTTSYNAAYDSLITDIDNFNTRAVQPNGFANRAQFDAERSQLMSRQQDLNNMYDNLSGLISETNKLVEEYNSNVIQIGNLYDSVNSHVDKPASIIEE